MEGATTIMPTQDELDYQDYLKSQQASVDPDYQEYLAATQGQESEVSMGVRETAKNLLNQAFPAISAVGEYVDRYTGAPTRSAIRAAQKGENPLTAAYQQFGEPTETAPTGKEIVEAAGVTQKPIGEYIPEGLLKETGKALAGSVIPGGSQLLGAYGEKAGEFVANTPVSSAAGLAVDIAADPTNLIPAGSISKAIGKAADLITPAKKLSKAAEIKAFKATGAMLKDFRAADKRGVVNEIGRIALDNGIVQAGDKVDDVLEKASKVKQAAGESIGSIHAGVIQKIDDPQFLSTLSDTQKLTLQESKIIPSRLAETLKSEIKTSFKGKPNGGTTIKRLEEMIDEVLVGDNAMNLKDVNSLKGQIDDLINYSKSANELPLYQQGLSKIRTSMQKSIEKQIDVLDKLVGSNEVKALKDQNKLFGASAQIESIAKDRVSRNTANRMFSPTDYAVGIGGALAGAQTGNTFEEKLKGAATGALLGGANKLLRERGPSTTAAFYNFLSKAKPVQKVASPAVIKSAKAARAASVTEKAKNDRKKSLEE